MAEIAKEEVQNNETSSDFFLANLAEAKWHTWQPPRRQNFFLFLYNNRL